MGVYTTDGVYHEMNVELANIHKLLLSVSALIEADHEVHFTKQRSWIRLSTKEEIEMKHEDGIFTIKFFEANEFPDFPGRVRA